MRCGFVASPIH